MKKYYSILLLFSFLIGAIQPMVPLLEYHFFKESIMELFCVNRDVPESDCEGFCYLTNQIDESRENQSNTQANYVDYYPGTVLCKQQNVLTIYPQKDERYPEYPVSGIYSPLTTDIPPPKFS